MPPSSDIPSKSDIKATLARMNEDDRAFLRRLKDEGEPGEARTFFDLFYYFPGTKSEEAPTS